MELRKKVNIITIHFGTNHGSVLQAYALSNYLQGIGHDVRIIDYVPERYNVWNSLLLRKKNKYPLPVIMAYYPFAVMKGYKVRKLFDSFVKNNLNLTRRYSSKEELKNCPPMADIYISGSDQVWNNDYNGDNEYSYFLDFVPNHAKKVAYAASFGKEDVPQKHLSDIKPLLQDFDKISVREADAKRILAPIGIYATHVVDPVFLFSKQEWREFATKHETDKPYILVYVMDGLYNELLDYAQKWKEQTGKKIYVVSFKKIKDQRIDKCFYLTSPKDFVGLIDNADAVITNSFHGTAFSILFQKDFMTVGKEKYNSRMCSLLSKLNLDKHFIPTGKNYGIMDMKTALEHSNAEQVETVLREWIAESKKYIDLSLKTGE